MLRLVPLGWGLEGTLLVAVSRLFCVSSLFVLACAAVAFALVDSSESGSIPLGWGPEGTLVVNSSPAGGSAPESVRYGGESYVFHNMLDNFINLTVNNIRSSQMI